MPRLFSFKMILFLITLLTLDVCFTPLLVRLGFHPVFLYLIVPYAAFEWSWEKAMKLALFTGLIRDLTLSSWLGLETGVMLFVSFAWLFFLAHADRSSLIIRLGMTFVFVLAASLASIFLDCFVDEEFMLSWPMISSVFHTAFCSMLLMPVFIALTARVFGGRRPLRQYELFA